MRSYVQQMGSKGQHLTVEQMFLFTIGILITVGIFLSFQSISDHVTDLAEDDQMREVGSLVVTGIKEVSNSLNENQKTSLRLQIPKRISRSPYTIVSEGERLTITLRQKDESVNVSLEGAGESNLVIGRVSSSTGRIEIRGDGEEGVIRLVRG